MALSLADKIVGLHEALDRASLPHAFGGALALAFCTAEPRATIDIDVNVFVGADRVPDLIQALPSGLEVSDDARAKLGRDAQARVWWDATPVDVFLSNHPFHDAARANVEAVPFAGIDLPVLACSDLAVFKAFFARPKDVLDVASMVAVGTIGLDGLRRQVDGLLAEPGSRDDFFERVADTVRQLG